MMTADWFYAEGFGQLVMQDWNEPPVVTTDGQQRNEIAAPGVVRIIEDVKPFCATATQPPEYLLIELLKQTPLKLTNTVVAFELEPGEVY